MAALNGHFKLAETIYLEQGQTEAAISMYQVLHKVLLLFLLKQVDLDIALPACSGTKPLQWQRRGATQT